MIKVIIVDDDELCQVVISDMISEINNITCVATFENALDAFSYLKKESVDVIFLDVDYQNTIFNDIKEGYNWCTEEKCCPSKNGQSNYGYKATYGFDLISGLGTPNIEKIKNWLFKNI